MTISCQSKKEARQNCDEYIVNYKDGSNVVILSLEDYSALKETAYLLGSPVNAKRLFESIESFKFEGIGKPEALKFDLGGFWSRRLDGKHRLVYGIKDDEEHILACRYHYGR